MKRAFLVAALVLVAMPGAADVPQKPVLDFSAAARQAETKRPAGVSPQLEKAIDEYELWNLQHRAESFRWQFFASKIIFWMVILLVLAGVAFSAIQFGVALRRRTDFSDAEVALSAEGVKVRSQFLGVITLALSLGFFYLYLKTVYPIVELPATTLQQATTGK